MNLTSAQERLLIQAALDGAFSSATTKAKQRIRQQLATIIREQFTLLQDSQGQQIIDEVEARKSGTRSPPQALLWLLGLAGLCAWARKNHPGALGKLGEVGLVREIRKWLEEQPAKHRLELLLAGIRFICDAAEAGDQTLLENTLGQMLAGKEAEMASPNFIFDVSRLPQSLRPQAEQDKFKKAVQDQLAGFPAPTDAKTKNNVEAVVIGMLLLDEQVNYSAPTFSESVRRAWEETLDKHKDFNGNDVTNVTVYNATVDLIVATRVNNQAATVDVLYQEFAFASRHAILNILNNPPTLPNNPNTPNPSFEAQVKIGLERYVAGRPAIESLELPPLTGADGGDVEIEPENIKAVALVYAASNLEEMRMFHVVDRITEIFLNGQLPVGFDTGGRALDNYYWDREDRLNEAERRMVYSRVLGVPGGMVSKEVQPNTQFNDLWIRFLSSLAEFDRQQRVDEIIATRTVRPQNLTGEYVRKAGRDLAANVSLYGWGGTHFAARRLNDHIATSLDILKEPPIQKAYGVTNPYQLIERVASAEFGVTPNIVRLRTMAEAGNKILNIIAKYPTVWTRSNGLPLFEERNPTYTGNAIPGDIKLADRDELMNQTHFWLAVNGIKDDQVDKLSQPEQSRYEPSIPTFAGLMPSPGAGASRNGAGPANTDALDRLKQMVLQGQAPSLDQLKQLLPM